MANILKNPSVRANKGYNGFNMSHIEKFSSTTGELLPVHFDLLSPGDKVTCNIELKTRTMELQSSAMVHIREHVDWFFVPMTQIWSIFGDWYYGIQDFKSSNFEPATARSNSLPFINSQSFIAACSVPYPDVFSVTYSYCRLLEMFGIPISTFRSADSFRIDTWPMSISPVFPCAYQKIWMDFYRNTDYLANDPKFYNLDKWSDTNFIDGFEARKFFTLRYRSANKDFYNNVVPSPLMGSQTLASYQGGDLTESFNQWLVSGLKYNTGNPVIRGTETNLTEQTFNGVDPTAINPLGGFPKLTADNVSVTGRANAAGRFDFEGLLSPTAIRTSFAVQKLLEVTRRAGKHYDRQTLAQFGVDVPYGIAGEVMYLGSQHGDINIGDVISTSTSSASGGGSSVLGQVSGKGYGFTKGRDVKFTAPCHGVLMALYSAETDRDYSNLGLDRLHTYIDRASWFTPEFDNLGMQPIFEYQRQLEDDSSINSEIFGWQYRWSELKLKFNRCSLALNQGRSLAYWTTQYPNNYSAGLMQMVSPFELNDVMLVPYQGRDLPSLNNSEWFNTDPLIHELYVDCKKASKMSTYGLEQL